MAYKLTIVDMESGEIKCEQVCDGIIGATISRGQRGRTSPESFSFWRNLPGIEVVSLLISLDYLRERMFAENHNIALGYLMREQIFNKRISVDMTELERQMGAK